MTRYEYRDLPQTNKKGVVLDELVELNRWGNAGWYFVERLSTGVVRMGRQLNPQTSEAQRGSTTPSEKK